MALPPLVVGAAAEESAPTNAHVYIRADSIDVLALRAFSGRRVIRARASADWSFRPVCSVACSVFQP